MSCTLPSSSSFSSSSSPISIPCSLSLPLRSSFQGASALSWPCPRRPRVVILFIPGNPGNVDWYRPYLDAIYHSRQCHGNVEILAVGHRGHSRLESDEASYWQGQGGISLEAQVQHKVEVVRTIRKAYPRNGTDAEHENDVKVILVGHSVGAWIGLKVLEQLREQVDGLQLLFPTVMNISRTPKAGTLPLLLLTSPLLPGLLLPPLLLLVSFIPSVIFLAALRIISPAPSSALKATFDFLTTPSAPLNAALMARDEFREIREFTAGLSVAVRQLKERGGTIRTYWSRGDEDSWAPSRSREELERAMGLTRLKLPAHFNSGSDHTSASLSKGGASTSKASLLRSRTLHVGSLTRAAGHRVTGGRFYSGSPQAKRSSNSFSPAGPGGSFPSTQSPLLSRSPYSDSVVPSAPLQQRDLNSLTTTTATSFTSPLRKRTIPMTSSGRRRPSINLAKARRSLDGTITLELPEGETWDYLEQRNLDDTGDNVFREEDEGEGEDRRQNGRKAVVAENDVFLDDGNAWDNRRVPFLGCSPSMSPMDMRDANSPSRQLGAVSSPIEGPTTPPRSSSSATVRGPSAVDRGAEALSSTVCELGMPHAFCLKWGPQMGRISAAWIDEDWL